MPHESAFLPMLGDFLNRSLDLKLSAVQEFESLRVLN